MSDNEVEDVSFLPASGPGNSGKRAQYEPSSSQRCKQLVCSPQRAVCIVILFVLIAVIIALIAALARQPSPCVSPSETPAVEKTKPTEAIATNGQIFPWKNIRLPTFITPLSYNLFLRPNLTTFNFHGTVEILLTTDNPTNFMIFHSKNLTIYIYDIFLTRKDDGVTVVHDKQINVIKDMEYKNHEQIYIEFDQELKPGRTYLLRLAFDGILNDGLMGFYRSSYETKDGVKRWLAATQFEPAHARAAFPCFDEPSYKANFTLSIVRESQHSSLFNTHLLKTIPHEQYFEDQFATSVKMSTYLVAFVICDFSNISGQTSSNIDVSVYAPGDLIQQAQFALNVSISVLDFYEDFYGIKYPLEKSDAIAIPDFAAGAMENWGLVTYLMRSLLYQPGESSSGDQEFVAIVIAHELAHQWFGNLVTMKWWNDLWLNEAFATFMEYIGVDHVKPEWKMQDQFLVDAMHTAMYSDGLRSSHPISVPVNDPSEIQEIFDAISYEKGASIIRMLEKFLGSDVFGAGLQDYLKQHQYGNAQTDDLWKALSYKSKEMGHEVDVKTIMDTWTLQMGYPVVTLTRDGKMVYASQERYLFNPRSKTSEEFTSLYDYKWEIPLTYISSENPEKQLQWMKKDSVNFQLSGTPSWVKANCNMTGFYRVHYDVNSWNALIRQLHINHKVFSPADRANLLADAFALARSGHLNISMALDMSLYLANEDEYVPWKIGIIALQDIGHLIEDKPEHSLLSEYILKLIHKQLHTIGLQDVGGHLVKYLRSLILSLAVEHGDGESIIKVKGLFQDWMGERSRVPSNLKSLVYNGGVRYGGDKEWRFVWKNYSNTISPTELNKLKYALAATRDATQLNRLLHISMDENLVRTSEMPYIVQSVANNPAGRAVAWRFVKTNWQQIFSRYGHLVSKLKRIILGSTGMLTTLTDYEEVKEFFDKHLPGSLSLRSVPQALEKIMMNVDWLSQNEATLIEWLKSRKSND